MIKSGLMEMDNIGNFHFIQIKTHTGTRHIIDKARYVNIHASMPPDQLPFTSRPKHEKYGIAKAKYKIPNAKCKLHISDMVWIKFACLNIEPCILRKHGMHICLVQLMVLFFLLSKHCPCKDQIFSYFSVSFLRKVRKVSRSWNTFLSSSQVPKCNFYSFHSAELQVCAVQDLSKLIDGFL